MLDIILYGVGGGVVGAGLGWAITRFIPKRTPQQKQSLLEHALSTTSNARDTQPEIMVKLIPAVNGRLIEVSTKKPHPMAAGHFDWDHEMFIVEEGQTLSQAIAMVMLMKGLEK